MHIMVTAAGAGFSSYGLVVYKGRARAAAAIRGGHGGVPPLQPHAGIHAGEEAHEFFVVNPPGHRSLL